MADNPTGECLRGPFRVHWFLIHWGLVAAARVVVPHCTDHEREDHLDRPRSRSSPVAHVAARAAPCALRPPRREVVSFPGQSCPQPPPTTTDHPRPNRTGTA